MDSAQAPAMTAEMFTAERKHNPRSKPCNGGAEREALAARSP